MKSKLQAQKSNRMEDTKMIKHIYTTITIVSIALCLTACSEKIGDNIYAGPEFVMFSDTLSTCPVFESAVPFSVPVVASTVTKYDRTFGVQVIDSKSNAIEDYHYRLESNTVTIPAGETRADIKVIGIYENLEASDSLGFALELLMPEQLESPLYGKSTNVVLMKSCPFNINSFTGFCVVTSTFLNEFSQNNSYQRVIWTEEVKGAPVSDDPDKTNYRIMCHDWQYDGYDVHLDLTYGDPFSPKVNIEADQPIGDELSVFGIIRGDNNIRVGSTAVYPSYFYSCDTYMTVGMMAYVNNLSSTYGVVGYFYNVMEWVSAAEARRLVNDGMPCGTEAALRMNK